MEINYQLKDIKISHEGVIINHVMYVLMIDFIAREQFKDKAEICADGSVGF